MKWILALPQLPASPSTLRVTVWRRMKEAGTLGLQNGVWLLPDNEAFARFAEDLVRYLKQHEADCLLLRVSAMDEVMESEMLARLRAERDEEYVEFIERCGVLLDDLQAETEQERFGFAELEEAEADLKKLNDWWERCTQRDFAVGERRVEAEGQLAECQAAVKSFADQVYGRQIETEEQAPL